MNATILRALLISLLLSGIGLAWVIYQVGSPEDLLIIKTLSPRYLVLAILALFLSLLLAALRLQLLCHPLGHHLKFQYALRTHILGIFTASVTPGGSGSMPAIALVLQHHGLSSPKAWAAGLSLFAIDAIFHAWGLPIALLILYRLQLYPRTPLATFLGIVTLILAFAVAYLVQFKVHWFAAITRTLFRGPLLRWRRRSLRFVELMVEANATFKQAPFHWYARVQGLSILSWICFFMVLYFIARGLALPVTFIGIQAAQMVITVMSTFIPTPGGSGFFEIGMSYLLIAKGGSTLVPAIVLLWRLMTYYSFFIIGPLLGGYLLVKHLSTNSK